jgi:hypothetical protein
MWVFSRGKWQDIALPFSDPVWTEAHRRMAATVIASALGRGATAREAEREAEEVVYGVLYDGLGIAGKEHGAPQNKKE